jgi:hypothetical protein
LEFESGSVLPGSGRSFENVYSEGAQRNEIVPLSVEFDGGCLKTVLSGHGAFQVNAAFSQTV